jgi:murein DD-endopeptidase MepM/ murein hydrolase activator NlpD
MSNPLLMPAPRLALVHGAALVAGAFAVPPIEERGPVKAAPAPPKKAVAKPAPKPKPRPTVKRVSRSKRAVAADLGGSGYYCPVAGRRSFTDSWGDSRSGGRPHHGPDIMAAYGTPIVAVIAGTIKTAYSSAGGISLYLRGVDGDEYFYAHNSRNVASSGERVAAGEVIGYVGTSGNAPDNAPHLHFERHPGGGAAVNPYAFVVRACR